MSTTVKVFIVLNLVMALAFMFIQMTLYATRENWKRRWNEDTKALAEELKADAQVISEQSFNKVRAENAVVKLQTEFNDLLAKNKEQEDEKADKDKQIQALNLTNSKNDEEIQALRNDAKTMSQTLELTRQSNNERTHIAAVARAAASVLNVKLSEVEDDYNKASSAVNERDEKIADLTKEDNKFKAQLSVLRQRHPSEWKEISEGSNNSATLLRAMVAAVKPNPQGQQDLVMLTIGKGDKVEEGEEFIIFRGNKYIVKVRAEQVLQDMVNCRVISDSWNDNHLQIQIGDLAQNRLF